MEFDETTQLLKVYGDTAAFPVMIQQWSMSWAQERQAVLHLGSCLVFAIRKSNDEFCVWMARGS